MAVDRERIRDRLLYIREQMALLRPLTEDPAAMSERLRDPLYFNGVVRSLQTSIEAMIDIAYHLAAKLHAREPENAANAFELPAERGALPPEFLTRFLGMVRFGNIAVHGYPRTKPEAGQSILLEDLSDSDTWERFVSQFVAAAKWPCCGWDPKGVNPPSRSFRCVVAPMEIGAFWRLHLLAP